MAETDLNIHVRPQLRARVKACAALEGIAMSEYIRAAIREHCERTERLHGRRMRAAKAVAEAAAAAEGQEDAQ